MVKTKSSLKRRFLTELKQRIAVVLLPIIYCLQDAILTPRNLRNKDFVVVLTPGLIFCGLALCLLGCGEEGNNHLDTYPQVQVEKSGKVWHPNPLTRLGLVSGEKGCE